MRLKTGDTNDRMHLLTRKSRGPSARMIRSASSAQKGGVVATGSEPVGAVSDLDDMGGDTKRDVLESYARALGVCGRKDTQSRMEGWRQTAARRIVAANGNWPQLGIIRSPGLKCTPHRAEHRITGQHMANSIPLLQPYLRSHQLYRPVISGSTGLTSLGFPRPRLALPKPTVRTRQIVHAPVHRIRYPS